ncbi:MAG: hypothetical protein KGK08_14240 [Acidobacteriota bacterium]|nr:hypothetical protein [Acidobacteriota bacterium]
MASIESVLHDMCQPLTVLRCRLELAVLRDDVATMQSAMQESIRECRRLNASVEAMRELVQASLAVRRLRAETSDANQVGKGSSR